MKRPTLAVLAAAIAVTVALVAPSCTPGGDTGDQPGSVTRLPAPESVLSEDLMLPLHQAKNLHRVADVYLQNGKVAEATESVRKILSLQFPAGAPEGEDVKLDARARLAKLLIPQGKLDEALKILDDGINGSTRESFFLSNVYTVKGEVHQAIAATLDDTDKEAAARQRIQAIDALETSIHIDRRLQKQLEGVTP